MKTLFIYIVFLSALLISCQQKNEDHSTVVAPWGEVKSDKLPTSSDFTLNDIITGGEMIMLTMTGPENYYDYHGRGLGTQFLLCERFAQTIGVSVRVELCKDTLEMVEKLNDHRADLIAFPLPKNIADADSMVFCGVHNDSLNISWAVALGNDELAKALDEWYKPGMEDSVRNEQKQLLASGGAVKRHVYSPFLNRSTGEISKYDPLFKKYARTCRWDWRLVAAQCYQESTFDPQARSWAGACGLMQIMPKTAAQLGLSMDDVYKPEPNIEAATRLIGQLMKQFSDIPGFGERQKYVLASYNGGIGHVRDAMALTEKMGGNPKRWDDVARHLMLLKQPEYYNDPVVKHGYIRSDETVNYVDLILKRYAQYTGGHYTPANHDPISGNFSPVTPRRAKNNHRFKSK